MKKISINLPDEIMSHIEFMKKYLMKIAPIRYTTTDVIIYAIETLYAKLVNESNNSDLI